MKKENFYSGIFGILCFLLTFGMFFIAFHDYEFMGLEPRTSDFQSTYTVIYVEKWGLLFKKVRYAYFNFKSIALNFIDEMGWQYEESE